MASTIKRLKDSGSPLLVLFALLLVSLYVLSDLTDSSSQFERYYLLLLVLNSLFLIALAILIALNVMRTLRAAVAKEPGSRLSLRLMLMFGSISLLPVVVVYWFSLQFIHKGIDSWFDVRVEEALTSSLELSRSAFDGSMRERRRETQPMVLELVDLPDSEVPLILNDLRERSDAVELTLFGPNNQIVGTVSDISTAIVPRLPDDSILLLLAQGKTYVGLDPVKDQGLLIRVIVPIPNTLTKNEFRALQALYSVSQRNNELADVVQTAFGKYQELVYLRKPLKRSLRLSLFLVLLGGVLFSLWAAFFSSKRLMAPLLELGEGTRAVASGDLSKKLTINRRDDIGFLAESFNQMTYQLTQARDEARHNQRLVEAQRAYLEAVLLNLSSGVLTLDQNLNLRTANAAAGHILGIDFNRYPSLDLCSIGKTEPLLQGFCLQLTDLLKSHRGRWQKEIALRANDTSKILMCRGTQLPHSDEANSDGHVLVFDDVTALIQAQRDAAWAEVARRLAHEIKNPLTPIQLAAERMHRKLPKDSSPEAKALVERSTHTIVQQVESLKSMVNAFSDYARAAAGKLGEVDLNQLITDVSDLYTCDSDQPALELNLQADLPLLSADPVRLRQVLHNLLKNAQEALSDRARGKVRLGTRSLPLSNQVELSISDNGPGFPPELMERLFEPYVTSKSRGTGLGLAIVKKIIEEHGGDLTAYNDPVTGGAHIRIHFPLPQYAAQNPSISAT